MADMQSTFLKFHNNIKMEPEELRQKRDILLEKIKTSLKAKGHPVPELVNQGSYIYGVGIKAIGELENDIDVGLAFNIKSADYKATTVREWVFEAIKDHTKNVVPRGPCIRVHYEAGYHVDLVCYAKYKDNDTVENFQLAQDDNQWKPSDPKKLKEIITDARAPFKKPKDDEGASADQLQRVTRYLKRWNDVAIPKDSKDKPFGLALLLYVMEKMPRPVLSAEGKSNDLQALIQITQAAKYTTGRISVKKPTPEYEDVFGKLSSTAMEQLKTRFSNLYTDLYKAQQEPDLEKACALLNKHFGNDFPTGLRKSELSEIETFAKDMRASAPSFASPAKPHRN